MRLNDEQRELVRKYKNLAYKQANLAYDRYNNKTKYLYFTREDIESCAFEALCRAAYLYDKDNGAKFITYATHYIYWFLNKHIYKKNSIIHVPPLGSTKGKKRREYVVALISGRNIHSFDSICYTNSNGDKNLRYEDVLEDEQIKKFFDNIELSDLIYTIFNEEERELLYIKYIKELTYAEMAKKFNTTASNISRKIRKIKQKSRDYVNQENII